MCKSNKDALKFILSKIGLKKKDVNLAKKGVQI